MYVMMYQSSVSVKHDEWKNQNVGCVITNRLKHYVIHIFHLISKFTELAVQNTKIKQLNSYKKYVMNDSADASI
jgi:hypothetical protein